MSLSSNRLRDRFRTAVGAWVALLMLAVAGQTAAAPISGAWIERWEEDLRFAQTKSAEQHPKLFHTLERAEWDREFDALIERLPTLEHHQAAVELARIIARVKDGHSRLTLPLGPGIDFMQGHSKTPAPSLPELLFRQYSVRFAIDSKGVHVERIATEHDEALGGRVTRLGKLSIADALAAVEPTIRWDNKQQIKHHLPVHLVLAEVLHARGVVDDMNALDIEVEVADGKTVTATLRPAAAGETIAWADASDGAKAPLPLYRRHPERRFWFEHLSDTRTIYMQMNEVYDEEDESLRDFAGRLGGFIEGQGVQNLIIDLRNNRGGNAALFRPLLHTILRSRVNRTGHLYILVGRTTFSAAMMFSMQLEKHTKALFVGEPTGSSPNHYGDSRKLQLPNTGMTLRISTLYWQYDPTDVRDALAPHIPAELTFEDYRAKRDPALEQVLKIIADRDAGRGDARGPWDGNAMLGLNLFDLSLEVASEPQASIRFQLPALGIDSLAARPRVEPRAISFVIQFRDNPITWNAGVAGDWLIGEGEYKTVPFPFVLERRSATAAQATSTSRSD